MKILVKLVMLFCFITMAFQAAWAEDYKVLVLPDNIQFESTNYYVYPDTSVMFASDIINSLKQNTKVQTISMMEIRDALRKDQKLSIKTKNALKEFKYNYNIPFVDFKSIADYFSTDKVLIITSTTDVQSQFLKRTIWDILNIPGAAVIDPTYKLSTYIALVDVNKEEVLWQYTFYKQLIAEECKIIPVGFAPATEQLEKIKFYSQYLLSPQVASIVQSKLIPVETFAVNGMIIQNNQNNPQQEIQSIDGLSGQDLKPATKPKVKNTTESIMLYDF